MREPRPQRSVRPFKQAATTKSRHGRQWRSWPSSTVDADPVCSEHLTATSSDVSSSSSVQQAKATRFVAGTSFSEDEEDLLVKLHALLGNRWSIIAGRLPGRTDEEVQVHWDSPAMRTKRGADPENHRVLLQALLASPDQHGQKQRSAVQNELEEQNCHSSTSSKDGGNVAAINDSAVSDAASSSDQYSVWQELTT